MKLSPTILNREEYQKKKRKQRIFRQSLIFSGVIVFIGFVSYVSHIQKIRISDITLSGGILVTEDMVEKETLSFVSGSYFWLFPKNNVLWYPDESLVMHLKNKFQRIDTLDMKLKDFHTLEITITEKKPIAIWCDNLPGKGVMEDGSIAEHCFFMDENGTLFASSPYFSGDAYFKYYGLIKGDSPIGSFYISSSTQFSQIRSFIETVDKLLLKPQYLLAKDNGEFSIMLGNSGEIYFDLEESLLKVGSNLEALIKTKELSDAISNRNLDYIDLRYGNKLFYKLKN